MVVGVIRLELELPGVASLKAKRSIVRKVVERTKSRFNASVAEVDRQDDYSVAVLGLAFAGSDEGYVNGALDKILDFIDSVGLAPIVSEDIEIIHFS